MSQAQRFLKRLKRDGFTLRVQDGNLFVAPRSKLTVEQADAIRQHKPALLKLLLRAKPVRVWTKEEAAARLLDHTEELVRYWLTVKVGHDVERLEGLAFSVFHLLDGYTGEQDLPPLAVVLPGGVSISGDLSGAWAERELSRIKGKADRS